ncbi:hypothetical protein BV372_15065, partial [Nostoc sp. T09]
MRWRNAFLKNTERSEVKQSQEFCGKSGITVQVLLIHIRVLQVKKCPIVIASETECSVRVASRREAISNSVIDLLQKWFLQEVGKGKRLKG